jgi:hypothetical protein
MAARPCFRAVAAAGAVAAQPEARLAVARPAVAKPARVKAATPPAGAAVKVRAARSPGAALGDALAGAEAVVVAARTNRGCRRSA